MVAKDSTPSAVTSAVAGGPSSESGSSTNITGKEEGAEDAAVSQRRPADKASKRSNPHKCLLYRPTLSQLMVYLATAFKVKQQPRYTIPNALGSLERIVAGGLMLWVYMFRKFPATLPYLSTFPRTV
jgi:hypothetical protein